MHVLANITLKPTDSFVTLSLIPYLTNFTLLFMMVSAFSMCCGYYERVKSGAISPCDFYRKRYARVWPFFAVMVVLSVAVDRDLRSVQEAVLDLTLCFNLLPNADIRTIGVGWFLGTIFAFYILFPFFTYLIDSRRKAWGVLAASLFVVYIAVNPLFEMGGIDRKNIVYSSPFFIVGGLVYLYREPLARWIDSHMMLATLLTVVLSVMVFMAVPVGAPLPILRELLFFTLLIIYALGARNAVLHNRVTSYLSKISMEVYLCHMMCFRVVAMLHIDRHIFDPDLLYVITVALTLVSAIGFSHVVKFHVLPRLSNACVAVGHRCGMINGC